MELTNWLAIAVIGTLVAIVGKLLVQTAAVSRRYQDGLRLYREQNYAAAAIAFQDVVDRQGSNDLARLLWGDCLVRQDRLDDAVIVFQDAVARSPKNIDTYLSLGKVLMRKGNLDAAIAQFQVAANIKPDRYPEPHRLLGLAKSETSDRAGAKQSLEKAQAIYRARGDRAMLATIQQELDYLEPSNETSGNSE